MFGFVMCVVPSPAAALSRSVCRLSGRLQRQPMEVEVVVENGDDSSEPVLTVEEVEDVELEGGHGQVRRRAP